MHGDIKDGAGHVRNDLPAIAGHNSELLKALGGLAYLADLVAVPVR